MLNILMEKNRSFILLEFVKSFMFMWILCDTHMATALPHIHTCAYFGGKKQGFYWWATQTFALFKEESIIKIYMYLGYKPSN